MNNDERFREYIQKFTFDTEKEWSRSRESSLKWCVDQHFQELQQGGYVDDMIRIFGSVKNMKILEIGSGTGGLSVGVSLKGVSRMESNPINMVFMHLC